MAIPTPTADLSHELISSRRIEGTPVYNQAGERLGEVHSVMLDKRSGQAAYVVMATAWFLGGTARVVPLEWNKFDYSADRRGYVVTLARDEIDRYPAMALNEADRPVAEAAAR